MKENYAYMKINNNNVDNINNENNINHSQKEIKFEIDNERIIIKNYKKFFFYVKYFKLGNTINFYLFNDDNNNNNFYSYSLESNQFIKTTLILIIIIIILLMFFKKIIKSKFFYIIFFLLLLISIFFAIKLLISNPGLILESSSNINNSYFCNKCKIYVEKFNNSFHCKWCNVCVYEFDHHCGIFGKCISKKNKIIFKISVCFGIAAETFCIFYICYQYLKIYKFI